MVFTKQFGEFVRDAESVGLILCGSDNPNRLYLGRRVAETFRPVAEIWISERNGKVYFYKAEPVGGAKTLDDFWSLKYLRQTLRIPVAKKPEQT